MPMLVSAFISPASPQDYDTAKLLKEAETQLKSLGQQLAQLEVAKRQAVEDEDYDRAKMLKVRTATTCQALPNAETESFPRVRCFSMGRSVPSTDFFCHCFPFRWRRIRSGYRSPPTRTPSSAPSWKKQACR